MTLFSASRLERTLGALVAAGFVILPSCLYQVAVSMSLVPFCLLLLMRGGDGLCIQIPVAVLNLGNQGGITGFTKKLPEKFLGKGRVLSNLLVHHLNKMLYLLAGGNDCKNRS